jgi:sec-independent protein translocase protein TatA
MRNLRDDESGLLEGLDLIIVLVVIAVLIVFGPSKLPDMFRSIGRALGEFRRGRMEVEREISQQFSALETQDARGKLDRAAGALGLAPAGKSELQVKLDIARAVDKAPDGQVVAAAQTLGIYNPDADMTTLKEKIIKSLNV